MTCHQCGSASMERLDRKEYRCTHCGAITVISDDDADRVERLLRDALARPDVTAIPSLRRGPSKTVGIVASAFAITVFAACLVLPLLLDGGRGRHATTTPRSTVADHTVPIDDVVISGLHWYPGDKVYEGVIYNHSGFAVAVPRYKMTLFVNGLKGDETYSSTVVDRLLPGEYQPIVFRFLSSDGNARYEIDRPARVERSTASIAPLDLTERQLVRQDDKSYYQLVGIVQNTLTRAVDPVDIVVTLYGADHQTLGHGSAHTPQLRPGEKAMADVSIFTHGDTSPVVAYEYLVDAAFSDRAR
ncbi:MAG TPA: FxLYD domain-containing protein [Aliidongia sp.]|uniref:FxLYD domain-containing protein n=1 Tax=Aliidongia sp. TaxID=1914230 RepID=UPI002DDDA698|nr:FxLYD domain-containing protein [Aliidongia sp.]HEV2675368.1 FxLYD domain-containing protein [Aliidongia sp.]